MRDVVTVSKAEKTYALIIPGDSPVSDARFFTENDESFQVGMFERPVGYRVKPHMHPEREINLTNTAECLMIQKGKARVTIYDPDDEWKELATEEVVAGDVVVFLRGGHSIEALEGLRFTEVKQGPFEGLDKGKVYRS